jgi:hypothetical protein
MKYRIKIYSSFCSCDHAKRSIEELLTNNISLYGEGSEDNVFIVGSTDDNFTHVIIWNTAMPSIPDHVPKKNVVGMAYEPPALLGLHDDFIIYAQKNVHKYYIGDASGLPLPFVSGNAYLTYSPPRPERCFLKHACMSIVVSRKYFLPGHQYRHAMVKCILDNNLPVDIFGNGTEVGKYVHHNSNRVVASDRIKGSFQKYEPYEGYLFHVCIENVETDDYFSEKVINPMLANAVPIYLGAKNIHSYFPDTIISLTGNLGVDMKMLVDILKNPLAFSRPIDVSKIEKKVSVVDNMQSIFSM